MAIPTSFSARAGQIALASVSTMGTEAPGPCNSFLRPTGAAPWSATSAATAIWTSWEPGMTGCRWTFGTTKASDQPDTRRRPRSARIHRQKIVSDNTWVRAVVVRVSLYGRAIQDKCNAGAVVSLLHDWRAALGCVALLLRRTDCRLTDSAATAAA